MRSYDRTAAFRSDFTALRKELADTKAGLQEQILVASRSRRPIHQTSLDDVNFLAMHG